VKKHTRQIAPRLANGDIRVSIGHGLPPHIKEGLKLIAYREHRSLSWVLEQVLIHYFGLRQPEYIIPKGKKRADVLAHGLDTRQRKAS
jgi:hypothetical protein